MPSIRPPAAHPVALAALAAFAVSGCASLGTPDWLQPGPARNQRRRAARFDPYPQDDIGPYAFRTYGIMDGARPRDFAEPVPEVRRARWWSQPLR